MAKSSCKCCYFFRYYCRLYSYSLRSSIIWNEILGVRASFRVVTVGHYRVFRFMGTFVHWLLFNTFWEKIEDFYASKIDKKWPLLIKENVTGKIEFTIDSVNWYWITFWEILFLRCLSEKCQGFGNELWFFGFRALVGSRLWLTSNDFFVGCLVRRRRSKDWSLLLNHPRWRLLIKK